MNNLCTAASTDDNDPAYPPGETTTSADPRVETLGLRPYDEVWELQRSLQQNLVQGHGEEVILVCEHPPTITLGRSAKSANVLLPREELAARGVTVFDIERGGDVTYHGPGQLVVYPILDLSRRKRDVGWYMRTLEGAIIGTLEKINIKGLRIPGNTGVWTKTAEGVIDSPSDSDPVRAHRKIASIGVRISRWVTLHGFSLNVEDCSQGFSLINPCGFVGLRSTSIAEESPELRDQLGSHIASEGHFIARTVINELLSLLRTHSCARE